MTESNTASDAAAPSPDRPCILLVDLSAVFWWKWHAAAGQPVDTAFEFTVGKVHSLAAEFDLVAVCCDARSFRYDLDPQYKGTRPPRDPVALEQLARVKTALTEQNFALLTCDGFEGDDIIATAVYQASQQPVRPEIVIAGMDKDLLALISPLVSMLHLQTGNVITSADVVKKTGVEPHQVRDFLVLVGDSSDNIKGVPGVGPKHAARLLKEFGTIDNLWQMLDQEDASGSPVVKPESIRKSLLASAGAIDLARKLVTLRTDAPIDVLASVRSHQPPARPTVAPTEPAPPLEEATTPVLPPGVVSTTQGTYTPDPPAVVAPVQPTAPAVSPPVQQPTQRVRFSAANVVRGGTDKTPHKFILTGRSGIGKTWFATSLPSVFMLPVEEGLKGANPDADPGKFDGPDAVPRTYGELMQALDVFGSEVNRRDAAGKRPFRHLALDSLTGLERLVHAEACGAERVRHMEAKEYGKVFAAAEPYWDAVQKKLDLIRHTGVNIWLIAHSQEVVDSTKDGDVFRKWDLALKGSGRAATEIRNFWRSWADHVFFMDWVAKVTKGDKSKRAVGKYEGRVLYTRETATHYAKTRARIPPTLPADVNDLMRALTAGLIAPEKKLRAELVALLPKLDDADRAVIEADMEGASTTSQLASLVSRAQGMAAIAEEDSSEEEQTPAEQTAES